MAHGVDYVIVFKNDPDRLAVSKVYIHKEAADQDKKELQKTHEQELFVQPIALDQRQPEDIHAIEQLSEVNHGVRR